MMISLCFVLVGALGAQAFVAPTSPALPWRGVSLAPVAGAQPRVGRVGRQGVVMMGRRSAKIANSKGKADLKRAKTFARIGKKIIMCVRAGGPNEDTNKALFDVLREAKALNVPKDNIQRAIKRADEGSVGDYKESVYEVYGHGGVGMVISCLSDNTNRALTEVKTVVKKQNLNLASSGSVAFQFTKRAKLEIQGELSEDEAIEIALGADLDDVEVMEGDEEGTTWVLTEPSDLSVMSHALEEAGHPNSPSLAYIPNATVECSDADVELNLTAIESMEGLEDVDLVEHNMA